MRSSGRSPSPFRPDPVSITTGDTLGFRLSVRITGVGGHRSGTARLWFNDGAANSRLEFLLNGTPTTYYLRDGFVLDTVTGGTKKTIDVFVDRAKNGNPFVSFGTWSKTF